jgi:hypothetical protein
LGRQGRDVVQQGPEPANKLLLGFQQERAGGVSVAIMVLVTGMSSGLVVVVGGGEG